MSDYMDFQMGKGDENIGGGRIDRFKGREGENYRVSFVWWPATEDGEPNLKAPGPRFIGAKRHYIEGVGYVLDKGPEMQKIAGGPPKTQVATVIAIWPTTREGSLDKARFASGDVEVKPWVFSRDKYDQLKRRHEEFPLGEHDIAIACTDSQYQKMDLSPCRENLFAKVLKSTKLRSVADNILKRMDEILEVDKEGHPAGLRNTIARDLTVAQVREKLGGGSSGGNQSFSSQATEDVDALLDDLID